MAKKKAEAAAVAAATAVIPAASPTEFPVLGENKPIQEVKQETEEVIVEDKIPSAVLDQSAATEVVFFILEFSD